MANHYSEKISTQCKNFNKLKKCIFKIHAKVTHSINQHEMLCLTPDFRCQIIRIYYLFSLQRVHMLWIIMLIWSGDRLRRTIKTMGAL